VRDASGVINTFDCPSSGTLTYQGTFPFSINSAGTIAGFCQDSNSVWHGFLRVP
jgi:hypothetical protein